MTKLGAVFLPSNPPERLRDIARAADEAGLEQLWLWEDCFLNGGVAAASAALAWTTRLSVGIGIVPVPFRNVALAAMEIATMRRMFGDRAIVGIGHGVQEWMAQVGAKAASPMTLLREHATALRALLHGETVTTHGRYVRLDAVALDWVPDPAPELLFGATGPKTLRLSGELADGTILVAGTSPEGVAAARAQIGGREGHELVVFVPAATGPTAERRIAKQQESSGMDFAGAAGDAKAVAATIERFAEAGATTVVLQPTADDPEPEGFVRFVAEEVRPLIG
ncbi:LLM class flavin-dependent oxidoreductase [Amorphoplanes digitatis]|uniref:Alkanesulfonate monooxygenase SsuD/methylene tetrahydromethanopterin reductase-like flavin-dependent oxidoreductase (Luciferase family) n=1 Tax=Actinoplanes digitatis TaxID=1868 RepID=A0A7W7MTS6_9ACTN|nr:LLM class flavin-dependent oxidoreductase [Actinoplanes digitatis]MBB4766102.1 alkanesulfonate monooxygenase SsuD/methylene tetrahydromethanopterin reductase-like flavin-dependent oxidoreductase (luciferase family) [Actinoplanes digitatis]GID98475.1 oxidoreductase [Actinoplanes digitatis]